MKFGKLETIVKEKANYLRESAGYSGSWSDGGEGALLGKLKEYKDTLVIELDLRPSEFSKLYDKEIGEPLLFSNIIGDYKLKLAKSIVDTMEL